MLRYHMAVVTRDNNLKREVKRVIVATASTADFIGDASGLNPSRPIQLAVFDARKELPDKLFLSKVPQDARIIYIIQPDALIERIPLFKDPRVASLLCHDERFDDDEFIATCTKALRGEIFGLQKYFPWGVTSMSMIVRSHEQKSRALDVLIQYANAAGVRGGVRDRIQLVADELMMNALWHAPVDAEGKEKYAGRSLKELAGLPEVDPIEVMYGCSGRYFGISVRDGGGSLTRERLLEYLLRAKNGTSIENKASGAGLGLISVLRSVSKLVFHLDRGRSTEVIALFDMELFAKGKMGARSLHVFSAPPARKEEAAEDEEAAAAPATPPPRANTRAWAAAAVLLSVVTALGTAVVMRRGGTASAAATTTAPAPAPEPTLTVRVEPADATVKLNGRTIPAGSPVALEAGTISVEKAGFASRQVAIEADGRSHTLYITLSPARK